VYFQGSRNENDLEHYGWYISKEPAHVVQLVHKPWVCILVIVMNQTTYSMQLVQLPS